MPKILPKVYASATGEPFRVEKYGEAKVEFYYFDNTTEATKLLTRQRFYAWTSDGLDYRLFVEKGYYERVGADLYNNKVNDIQLDFTNFVHKTQKQMNRKYLLTSLCAFAIAVAVSIGLSFIPNFEQAAVIGPMVALFLVIFIISHKIQGKLKTAVRAENEKASKAIRDYLGEHRFERILEEQQAYLAEYFHYEDDEDETPLDGVSSIDAERGDSSINDPIETIDAEILAEETQSTKKAGG